MRSIPVASVAECVEKVGRDDVRVNTSGNLDVDENGKGIMSGQQMVCERARQAGDSRSVGCCQLMVVVN